MYRLILHVFIICSGLNLLSGCSKEKDNPLSNAEDDVYDWSKHTPFTADYEDFLVPSNTTLYGQDPVNLGSLHLDEASGLAVSMNNAGMLWTHEDGGNGNKLYLIDAHTAEILCTYRIGGASNNDWEDMEVVKHPSSGKVYIYISDTGDNDQNRNLSIVYKIEEPIYDPTDKGREITTPNEGTTRYSFRYHDGSRDVEAMMVDKDTEDIYFITKRDVKSRLYILPSPQAPGSTATAYFVGEFGFREASGAAVNATTDRFIVRNRQALFYWEKNAQETIWEMLKRRPEKLPFAGEVQGEAVCFDLQNNYYTTSEKAGYPMYPPLYKYVKQ